VCFQSPEKHLCGGRIVAASRQRFDHLALMGDVLLSAMEKAFGFLKSCFSVVRSIGDSLAANIPAKAVFLPVESI